MDYQIKNEQLLIEYTNYYHHLLGLFDEDTKKTLSLPLFMYVYPEYDTAAKKIMVVGQETKKWFATLNKERTAERIVQHYKQFELAKNYHNSPFWRFNREFYGKNNPGNDKKNLKGMLWSNLSRVDQNGKPTSKEIQSKNKAGYELLAKEIKITKPDTVIFLTSYRFDDTLKRSFEDLKLERIEKIDRNYLVRVKSSVLPINSFRTYHPRFLNDSTKSKYSINQIIDLIQANSL